MNSLPKPSSGQKPHRAARYKSTTSRKGGKQLEQALQLWGPAAVILTVLIVVIKWFMSFIDGQAKRIEKMTDSFNETIQTHMIESLKLLVETRRAVDELCHLLKLNNNGAKLKV